MGFMVAYPPQLAIRRVELKSLHEWLGCVSSVRGFPFVEKGIVLESAGKNLCLVTHGKGLRFHQMIGLCCRLKNGSVLPYPFPDLNGPIQRGTSIRRVHPVLGG